MRWGVAWLGIGALAVLLAGSSCGGEGSACRSSDDCQGSLECAGPSEPQVCGIAPNQQCSTDADCFDSFCHAVFDACSPDGIGSECRPACTETSCGEGLRCGAGGGCEAIPCDEGFACASYQACDPSAAAGGLAHGCVAIVCSDDDACPSDGACVNGVCQEGVGSCVEPMLVP